MIITEQYYENNFCQQFKIGSCLYKELSEAFKNENFKTNDWIS